LALHARLRLRLPSSEIQTDWVGETV
jgi:hypothetical protein